MSTQVTDTCNATLEPFLTLLWLASPDPQVVGRGRTDSEETDPDPSRVPDNRQHSVVQHNGPELLSTGKVGPLLAMVLDVIKRHVPDNNERYVTYLCPVHFSTR